MLERLTTTISNGFFLSAARKASLVGISGLLLVAMSTMAKPNTASATAAQDLPLDLPEMHTAAELAQQTMHFAQQHLAAAAGERLIFKPGQLDARLRMRRCTQPLEFEKPNNNRRSHRVLIKVRCEDHKPWAIFVPVQVETWRTLVIAKHTINRNQTIEASDLSTQEIKVSADHRHHFSSIDQAVGQLATRAIAGGSIVNAQWLTQPKWVKRGDEVSITASSAGGVNVRMMGTAMADGRKNDQIPVRNQSSKRLIKARVVGRGQVKAIL